MRAVDSDLGRIERRQRDWGRPASEPLTDREREDTSYVAIRGGWVSPAAVCSLLQEVRRLRAQLPAEMQHCTILFKECEKGHGRLTAANWIDHGCSTCEIEKLEERGYGMTKNERLEKSLKKCVAAMERSVRQGYTDHLDDEGGFWYDAIKEAERALAEK